ncbi:unnamed protein product [Rhizoctonia solani]|uniref:Nephrocystin 3-like N-terminal domain-containing protein n=1 Tax=Rhizoctonia solani TaxID=456999 RepID=A0A8H3GZM1_9AGAM|nr:unnamed protein product [Rhizoctonia solani]
MSQTSGPASTSATGGATTPIRPKRKNRDGLRKLVNTLAQAADAFGPLKAVVDEIAEMIENYQSTTEESRDYEKLHDDLEILLEDLSKCFSGTVHPTMTRGVEGLCNVIKEELHHLKQNNPRSRSAADLRRRYSEGDYPDVSLCYQRIQSHFQRLVLNINTTLWKINDEQAAENKLKNMSPAMSACYNSAQSIGLKRGPCTENTRLDVLDKMNRWIYNSPDGAVYWLSGMAGTGKTTIAYSLCAGLDLACKLGANFFCSRLLPECRDVSRIIPSIAYQLARFSLPFRCALLPVLQNDPEVHTRILQIQFEALIVGPLMKIRDTLPTNLIVVIDALDECEDQGSAGQILGLLLNSSPEGLPIKFFVSSRPEPQIRDQIMVEDQIRASARLILHELDQSIVRADIETYLRAALKPMNPSEFHIRELGNRAGILFIYASTAVRYIGYDNFRRNPLSRLEAVLGISLQPRSLKHNEIDTLYMAILGSAFDDKNLDEIDKEDMKQVLHTVICGQEPLTVGALAELLKFHDVDRVQAALRPLWSVLHVMEASGLVTTLHASFPDFLSNADRSHQYWCDTAAHEGFLASICFDYVRSFTPQFNICRLESSYVPDDKIANLDARISEAVPIQLFYACRYWGVHLRAAHKSPNLITKLDDFLSKRLLLWMEVLNLRKSIMIGTTILGSVQQLGIISGYPEELLDLIKDALQFVMAFALSAVANSTPHLYVSMLQSWPQSLPIAKRYEKYMRRMTYTDGAIMGRLDENLSVWPVDDRVFSIGLSPDGSFAAVAVDKDIWVMNTPTGRMTAAPLRGHSQVVKSVTFSPDGTQIASGSADTTVRVWNFQTGRLVLPSLNGHTGPVTSVVFSTKGDRIFSASEDRTIRIWDAQTGKIALDPLEGHTGAVASLGLSSDGARIVSGSYDRTARVWDTRTGRSLLTPLQGHDDPVVSVVFSPDNSRIASGSRDQTIRVWDAENGQLIFSPLRGHAHWVTSVAFSPDGAYIVSGSNDRTIRLWDAQEGGALRDPLRGHTGVVATVGFLPGGTHIYSGSWDKTIRVWHVERDRTKFMGHEGQVLSVTFSPDGKHIVSGSEDATLCVWEALSGRIVHKLAEIHTGSVNSVRFSPDGTRIVSGSLDGTVCVADTQNGFNLIHRLRKHGASVSSVDFSPDNSRVVSGSDDCDIIVWDPLSGHLLLRIDGKDTIRSVRFSSDSTLIASISWREVMVWDARTGSLVHTFEKTQQIKAPKLIDPALVPVYLDNNMIELLDDTVELRSDISSMGRSTMMLLENSMNVVAAMPVKSIDFSPRGNILISGHQGGHVVAWATESGTQIEIKRFGVKRVTCVRFSPDGNRIACCLEDWDYRIIITGMPKQSSTLTHSDLGPLIGHLGSVTSMDFSPDGTRPVSSSMDQTMRVWDTRTLRPERWGPDNEVVREWHFLDNGWVVDKQSRLLFWVPPRPRDHLKNNQTTLVIASDYSFSVNFDEEKLGESWTECFQPECTL